MSALAVPSTEDPVPAVEPGGRRGWLLATAGVLGLFVVVGLIGALTPAPQGPAGSSYATSGHGAAGWAALLAQDGHRVSRLRTPLAEARLAPGDTLVVIGARTLSATTGRRLRHFVTGGGRPVLAGSGPSVAGTVLSGGVGSVASAPVGVRSPSVVRRALGAGRLESLPDAASIENDGLGQGANALLALRIVGPRGRPVVFAEALHGYTAATGLAAFPARWWVTIAGLALAAAAWAVARGRRLGPAEPTAPAPVPPRAAYVEAMTRALLTASRPRRGFPGARE